MKSDLIIKLLKICCLFPILAGANLAYAGSRDFTFYYGSGVNQFSLQFNGINNKAHWTGDDEPYEVSVTNGLGYTKVTVKGRMDTGDVQLYGNNYTDNNSIPVNSKEDMPQGNKFDFITYFYVTINNNPDTDGAFTVASQTNAGHTWWLGDYNHGGSQQNSKGKKCLDYLGYSFVPRDDNSVVVNGYSCQANGY